ncbi:hypothetical protein QMZ92_22245 [Streptomyces sp. HNM0645]|nr:hypothetical protein [Streptomyces sp. HNM0645]MDI9887015.1 hypothetical protein [Streptomyces sp. HNM0645]
MPEGTPGRRSYTAGAHGLPLGRARYATDPTLVAHSAEVGAVEPSADRRP